MTGLNAKINPTGQTVGRQAGTECIYTLSQRSIKSNRDFFPIRSKPDIVSVISRYLTLRKTGQNFVSRCLFHDEKTPSFNVNTDKQIFRCFGCGSHGDVIDFIQQLHGTDFKGALSILGLSSDRPYQPDPVQLRKRELVKKFEEWKRKQDGQLLDLHRLTLELMDIATEPGRSDLQRILEAVQKQLEIFDSRDDEVIFTLYRQVRHEK